VVVDELVEQLSTKRNASMARARAIAALSETR
jgi:hypothetical protein